MGRRQRTGLIRIQQARVMRRVPVAQEATMEGTPRCHHCGDVIGVYEPMTVLVRGEARRTSRAAERHTGTLDGECYHSACYAEAYGEDRVPEQA
jgi:hypothetical protein